MFRRSYEKWYVTGSEMDSRSDWFLPSNRKQWCYHCFTILDNASTHFPLTYSYFILKKACLEMSCIRTEADSVYTLGVWLNSRIVVNPPLRITVNTSPKFRLEDDYELKVSHRRPPWDRTWRKLYWQSDDDVDYGDYVDDYVVDDVSDVKKRGVL